MDDNGVETASGQSAKDLVLETASERWAVLTPAERQIWLDQRRTRIDQRRAAGAMPRWSGERSAPLDGGTATLNPEQRAALRESAQAASFDRFSSRGRNGGFNR